MLYLGLTMSLFLFNQEVAQTITCYANENGPHNGNQLLVSQENCTMCMFQQNLESESVIQTIRRCSRCCHPENIANNVTRVCCTVDLCNYDKEKAIDGQLGPEHLD
ncbi:hypothetical protein CRM22_004196 [Opisthorchis felineus]|nr:hypothetical protein CRM22_004196 [Opisthorchis felineus]